MSNTFGRPGQDLPEPVLPGQGESDVIGQPDAGAGIGNDLPTKPAGTNPMNEPDPTSPGPSVPGVTDRTN